MAIKVVTNKIEIHVTPLEEIIIIDNLIKIRFDDINENRWEIMFKPFQAFKVTTIDCVSATDFFAKDSYDSEGIYHRYLLEVTESSWISSLTKALVDETADFMEKSHHYVLPFQDNIIEVVSWEDYVLEQIN